MKKIIKTLNLFQCCITGIILLLSFSLSAQQLENDALTYTHEATLILAPLLEADETLYKNGILYDRVMGLGSLRDVNTNTTTHGIHFQRTWQELFNARLHPTTKHISLNDLKQISNHYQKQDIIPVGLINMDFTQFTTATLEDFETDNITITQLVNRNRATSPSPYEDRHLFLASPVITGAIKTAFNTPVTFKTDIFVLDQAALPFHNVQVTYNNTTKTIIQNGAFVNTNFTYSFTTSGLKTLTFKATYTNGKQLISTASINVEIIEVLNRNNAIEKIEATESFKGYDEAADCGGNCFGEGEYQIFFGDENNGIERTKLKKPIIILDGFDPGDIRKIDNGKGSITYLIDNGFKEDNMRKFKAAGFDVVILNFPNYPIRTENKSVFNPTTNQYVNISTTIYRDGGADYIERNANVLKALITKLNGKLVANGSTEKIKIIGPSMGGLISRVALTQMEQANQNHNTDIWVSFDSPHLGANIPIGLQYFFTFMEQEQVALLKSPAARQMLLIQNPPPFTLQQLATTYGANSFIYMLLAPEVKKYPGNYTFRNTFKNLLNNLGFPDSTNRNLALINGSINGTRQGTPKSLDLDIDLKVIKTLFGSLGRYQIKTFTTHDGGRHKIFERYKRILFFPNTKSVYLADNSGNGSLDNSPGGTFDMKNEFESTLGITLPLTNANAGIAVENLLKEPNEPSNLGIRLMAPIILGAFGTTVYLNLNQGTPSFIPTKSSLAFTGTNKVWHETLSNRNLVCSGETPFDSYFAPSENEPHVTLNSKNIAWILEEFRGNQQNPSFQMPSENMQGASRICQNTTEVYSFSNCQFNATSWEISGNLTKVWSNSKHIAVKPKTGVNYGAALITAINGDKSVTKQVNLGYHLYTNITEVPAASIQHLLPTAPLGNTDIGLQLNFNASTTEIEKIEWQKIGSNFIWSQDNNLYGNDNRVIISKNCNGPIEFKVRVKNSCGWSNWQDITYNITSCSTNCAGVGSGISTGVNSNNFDVYPVPSTVNLTVKIKNQPPAILQSGEFFIVTLYNKVFRIKREVNGIANSITVPTSDLPAGSYILTIQYNNIYESHTILID